MWFPMLVGCHKRLIIATVFHRILDFKTGLNFYSDPFFILCRILQIAYFQKLSFVIQYSMVSFWKFLILI